MKSSFRLSVLSSQFTKFLFCFISSVIFHMLPVTAVYAELPDRIVSLAPSTTEILFAMGLVTGLSASQTFAIILRRQKRNQRPKQKS